MLRWFAPLLVVSFLLAGCSGSSDNTPETPDIPADVGSGVDPADDGGKSRPGDKPSPGAPPSDPGSDPVMENMAPIVEIVPSVLSGPAPLTVQFNLQAQDPDEDALGWSFDANGDTELEATDADGELPFTFNYTYAEVGLFNATLAVNDDHNEIVYKTVTIEVGALVGAETWYFYWPGDGSGGCGDPIISIIAGEDVGGCQFLDSAAYPVITQAFDVSNTFAGREASTGHGAGAAVQGVLLVGFTGGFVGDVTWELRSGDDIVLSGSQSFQTAGAGTAEVAITGATAVPIDDGDILSVNVNVATASVYSIPREGSMFTIA